MKKQNVIHGNPYLDNLEAKERANQALAILSKSFSKIERVSRKQIYFIPNNGKSFYVQITSAPANLKTIEAIKGISKQYGKFPYYIVFTRDVNDYPDASAGIYWNKLKALPTKLGKKFLGSIISLEDLSKTIPDMKKVTKLSLNADDFNAKTGNKLGEQFLLKEIVKLTPKQIDQVISIINVLKK